MDKISDSLLSVAKQTPTALKKDMSLSAEDSTKVDQAAEQFEAMLALQMVRTMQKSLENGNMFGDSVAGDVYSGLTEWELARMVAKNANFGIKENILQQMKNREDSANEVHSR